MKQELKNGIYEKNTKVSENLNIFSKLVSILKALG